MWTLESNRSNWRGHLQESVIDSAHSRAHGTSRGGGSRRNDESQGSHGHDRNVMVSNHAPAPDALVKAEL